MYMSNFNRRLLNYSLRHISSRRLLTNHRQSYYLNVSSSSFSTLNNNNFRRRTGWRKDQVFAVATWILVGTGAFVLVGTTTAASFGLLLANSLQFQEYIAGKLGKWLACSLGWKVSFGGSAIVPNWRDGRITLRDLSIELGDVNQSDTEIPSYGTEVPLGENYTRFSIQVERLDIRISLRRWLEGKGLLEEVLIDGARGILDKRWIRFIEGWKWKAKPGDFDLNSLQVRNVHLSIIQPVGFRPYNVTILSASIPRLRASWFFYDLLAAESAHGIFDGRSLFTLHTTHSAEEGRELKHFRMLGLDVRHLNQGGGGGVDNSLGWVTRGTVDIEGFYQLPQVERDTNGNDLLTESFNLSPDTLKEKLLLPLLLTKKSTNRLKFNDDNENDGEDERSPLKYWYDSRIRPKLPDGLTTISDKLASFPEKMCDRLIERLLTDLNQIDFGGLESAEEAAEHFLKAPEDCLAFQVDFIFRNLRAKLPSNGGGEDQLGGSVLLLRPVIGYVNEHRPLIPLSCHFTLKQAQFRGAWSGYESGLISALTVNLEAAFQKLVWDPERRMQRLGKIGRWTLGNYLKSATVYKDTG